MTSRYTRSGFGLCIIRFGGPYLGYSPQGWGQWLPVQIQHSIVTMWNRVVCLYNGHVPIEEPDESVPCVHCGVKR